MSVIELVGRDARFDDSRSVFAARINANNRCDSDSLCWVQNGGAAVFQRSGGVVTAYAEEGADFDEAAEFLQMIGFERIFTDAALATSLPFNTVQQGTVMRCTGDSNVVATTKTSQFLQLPFLEYSRLYKLLEVCGQAPRGYEQFAAALSPRIRGENAHAVVTADYSAAAFTAWESETAAVIAAVTVSPGRRRLGLGSAACAALLSVEALRGKSIYLYRENDKNEQFYIKNGFENSGEFFVLESNNSKYKINK